jgi:hypothetical protein
MGRPGSALLSLPTQGEAKMQSLASLKTAATLKALREQGLTNPDIIQMVKADGWSAVKSLVQEGR